MNITISSTGSLRTYRRSDSPKLFDLTTLNLWCALFMRFTFEKASGKRHALSLFSSYRKFWFPALRRSSDYNRQPSKNSQSNCTTDLIKSCNDTCFLCGEPFTKVVKESPIEQHISSLLEIKLCCFNTHAQYLYYPIVYLLVKVKFYRLILLV